MIARPVDKSLNGELQLIAIGPGRLLCARGAAPLELTLYDGAGNYLGGFIQDTGASINRRFDIQCDGLYALVDTPYPLVIEYE